jgi:hypothetical protein
MQSPTRSEELLKFGVHQHVSGNYNDLAVRQTYFRRYRRSSSRHYNIRDSYTTAICDITLQKAISRIVRSISAKYLHVSARYLASRLVSHGGVT